MTSVGIPARPPVARKPLVQVRDRGEGRKQWEVTEGGWQGQRRGEVHVVLCSMLCHAVCSKGGVQHPDRLILLCMVLFIMPCCADKAAK
jgi:hypothetical protein